MQKLLAFITSLFTALTSVSAPTPTPPPNPNVLGDTTAGLIFSVNIPARFKDNISAPNVVYSVNGESGEITVTEYEAGEGVSIEDGVISNTGILTLTAGDGISISGNKITSTITQGITSLTAGSGISISGSTITNTSTPDYTLSGWTDNGTSITLTTTTDTVTVGALTAGAVTVDSLTTDGLSLTSDLTVASGHSLLPEIDLGSDIGTSSKRFNNLWVANINSNSSQSFAGQSTFSYAPTDTTITEASVIINPTTSVANGQLLGLAIGGYQKALIDEDGDIILGYSDATSAPATDYPLNIYGHSGTRVSFVDTSGNGYFAGNVGIGTAASSNLLDVTDGTGSVFSVTRSGGSELVQIGALRLQENNNNGYVGNYSAATQTLYLQNWGSGKLNLDLNESSLYIVGSSGNVGIGTTSPQRTLDVSSTGNITFGDAVSTGSNERGIYWFSGNDYGIYRASGSWATLPKLNIAFNTGFNFSTGSPNTPKLTLSNTGGLSLGNSYTATDPGAGNMIISGNVGIGTTAPGYKLEVNGGSVYTSGSVTAHTSLVSHDIVSTERIFRYSDGDLSINNSWAGRNIGFTTKQAGGTTNSNQLYLQSTGNVGIGTTSPGQKLHLVGGDGSSPATSGTTQAGASLRIQYPSNNTAFDMGTMSSGGAWMQVTNATNLGLNYKLLLNPNGGNVGIGTTSPGASLHIVNTADNQLRIGNTSGYYFDFGRNNTSGFLSIQGNQTGYNSILLAPTSGNVGIGTSNPSYKLDVAGTLNTTGATTLGSTLDVSGLTTITGTSGSNALQINRSGAEVLGILTGTNYANLNLVDSSTEPTNLLTNSTFNSDLTSWSEVPSYTLNDQFTTNRAAGAVNGTSAEPTGGTRTVTDTGNRLSIGGGTANFVTGGTVSDPRLNYNTITRTPGLILIGKANITSGNGRILTYSDSGGITNGYGIGLGTDTGATIDIRENNSSKRVGSFSFSTDYQSAIVLRSTGAYHYIKGGEFTNWQLLWISSVANGNYNPGIAVAGNATADNIRIPTSTWLPTPLAYDTFTRADGAIGSSETTGPDSQTTPSLEWTGGAISGNKMVITPTLGSELVTNGNMETGSPPSNWAPVDGTVTTTSVADERTGGSGSNAINVAASGIGGAYQDLSTSTGTWLFVNGWSRKNTGNANMYLYGGPGFTGVNIIAQNSSTTWTNNFAVVRATSVSPRTYLYEASVGADARFDDISVKPLTLSSLFSTVSTSDTDVIADVGVTLTAGTQAGLVTNLDSTSSPANFLIAYHDGTNVKLEKNVGGTYTTVQSTAATYSAGATLRVITYHSDANTLKVRVYYNNALVGSEQTVTDAGIISNTKHGLFSTYSGNSFDNFSLFARGTGAEYTSAPFEELTATRDTSTYYAGGASAKLVADGTDANYLQSVNVGDTSTYNLIAYAYTDGSAVTSSDLELYYDTDTITTTYTPIGGGGWYRLSGTLTGVASAKDYGVRVKAGKTVYVDEMKLQAGTASTQTMYVTNTGTGVTGLSVQGLINGTVNGVASFSKAGTISDSDFSGGVSDGLFGFDTTNHRLYFREGGSWSYIARTAGFQIPKEEVAGLSQGDYLMPYVEHFMSDGAVHGLYQKFDLNQVLAREGAVTFATAPIFPNNMAGTAVISTFSDHVDVDFTTPFISTPSVSINLTFPDSNHTYLESGLLATTTNVTPTGFSIILPTLAPRDFTYHWTAIAVEKMTTTQSDSVIQNFLDSQSDTVSPSLTPSPTASDSAILQP